MLPITLTADELFVRLQTALAGRYSLDRELGRGGMGIVYLAREVHLDRLVAIKLLPPELAADTATRERFLHEARTAARLSHPHIIPVHAVEVVEGFVFHVMTYVDGESLTQRVATRGPLSAKDGARLLREVAWALAHAHAQGIVHRDIKPDNILIERESGRAIVADFGIAAAIGDSDAGTHGTPEFMSPEQALGRAPDVRSDIYALGATAFFAFSGRVPFTGDTSAQVLSQLVSAPAPSLHAVGVAVPRKLAKMVQQCLAKDPAQRPSDALQFADLLGESVVVRRELPAALRAFVKRDGRTDGPGTILTLVGTQVAAIAASNVAGVGAYVVGTIASAFIAPMVFGVVSAYRLSKRGFAQADLEPAFVTEWESLREERGVQSRRAVSWLEGIAAAVTRVTTGMLLVTAPMLIGTPIGERLAPVAELVVLLVAIVAVSGFGWLLLASMQRDVDVAFWRRVWTGRFGRLSFALARRLGARPATSAAMTHRATELSLSLAAEQLFDSLPRETRDALRDVPPALAQLQQDAAALRRRLGQLDEVCASVSPGDETLDGLRAERVTVAARLRDSVSALELLRLNLLRLHAGTIGVESVTTHIGLAVEASDQVRRHAEARQEVDDVFAEVRASDDVPAAAARDEAWA
jgi:serine/threonine-protein kinase